MVDTLVEKNSTVYFTQATITWARLRAFVPLIALSEELIYVIKNMRCCNNSLELEQYIREFIIGEFGLTYVKELLLGGVAQQQVIISEENRKTLQANGVTNTNEAEAKVAAFIFSASLKIGIEETIDKTKIDTFKTFSQQTSITTLGGTPSVQSFEDWSKTVPLNPVIIKFTIANILDLLTTSHFPTDPDIETKRNLIKKVQEKYIDMPLFCYNNCSEHGVCVSTEYFGYGKCRCNAGWNGRDCSIVKLPAGSLAMVSQLGICPTGFIAGLRVLGVYITQPYFNKEQKFFQVCSLVDEKTTVGPQGTLCGFVYFGMTILCDTSNPYSDSCPHGFSRYSKTIPGQYPVTFWGCEKNITNIVDPPGTLCGFHSTLNNEGGVDTTCNGYDLGQGACPPDYIIHRGRTSDELSGATIRFCAKK